MADDAKHTDGGTPRPTLRQELHAATGDREAEAKALADRAGDDVTVDDAKAAVKRVHGDVAGDKPRGVTPPDEIATPDDAEAVHNRRSTH